MKIAFMHYHLNTGGVTSTIRRQVNAIRNSCSCLVLSAEPPATDWPVTVRIIDGIGYDTSPASHTSSRSAAMAVADAIHDAIESHWPEGCDILHVHNPTLAKNRRILTILNRLQQMGLRLLIQIHDFAEDGRPHLYHHGPYPANCHYAVLNARDYQILTAVGLNTRGVHILPNAVSPPATKQGDAAAESNTGSHPKRKGHVLYPVRAIRRKNIGEALLVSLFLPDDLRLLVTLPPTSPPDMPGYHRWQAMARNLDLNVKFGAGLTRTFSDLMQHAAYVITTSISEGFGFSYVEPWLYGKFLWGRALPVICHDLKAGGLLLDHLYSQLRVPLSWIDATALFDMWRSAVLESAQLFDYAVSTKQIETAFSKMTVSHLIDFAMLEETLQASIIKRLYSNSNALATLKMLNPFLDRIPAITDHESIVEINRRAVVKLFHPRVIGRRLISVYKKIVNTPVRQRIRKTAVLNAFFNLSDFSLLKWGPPPAVTRDTAEKQCLVG